MANLSKSRRAVRCRIRIVSDRPKQSQQRLTSKARPKGQAIFGRLVLGWGKIRRTYLLIFRPGYVKKSIRRRAGECKRCGACCRLMFTCPYLDGDASLSSCRKHNSRPDICRRFPIDERDIKDRDRILPDIPCGFSFRQ